jgi:serine/threonine-protein kinase
LITIGFNKYSIQHETYALTRVLAFVMTGKIEIDKIDDANIIDFIRKGLNTDIKMRFKNVYEMQKYFNELFV